MYPTKGFNPVKAWGDNTGNSGGHNGSRISAKEK